MDSRCGRVGGEEAHPSNASGSPPIPSSRTPDAGREAGAFLYDYGRFRPEADIAQGEHRARQITYAI